MTIESEPYTRIYRVPPFPVPRTEEAAKAVGMPWPLGETDEEVEDTIQWLMREGVERKADADGLVIVEYRDLGETPPENINPLADRQLGRPARDFTWRTFEAVGIRPDA